MLSFSVPGGTEKINGLWFARAGSVFWLILQILHSITTVGRKEFLKKLVLILKNRI